MSIPRRHYVAACVSLSVLILLTACSSPKRSQPTESPTSPKATEVTSATPTSPAAAPMAAPPTQDPAEAVRVYVTAKGKNYHRDGCKFLWRSKNPLTLKDAIAKGYKACTVCKPPTLASFQSPAAPSTAGPETMGKATNEGAPGAPAPKSSEQPKSDTVYVNMGGRNYHVATCKYVGKGATAMSKSEATAKGFTPCPICRPKPAEPAKPKSATKKP